MYNPTVFYMIAALAALAATGQPCSVRVTPMQTERGSCAPYNQTIGVCNDRFTNPFSVCVMDVPASNITDMIRSTLDKSSKSVQVMTDSCDSAMKTFYCAWYMPQCGSKNASLPVCLQQCVDFLVECNSLTTAYATASCKDFGSLVNDGVPGETCTGTKPYQTARTQDTPSKPSTSGAKRLFPFTFGLF